MADAQEIFLPLVAGLALLGGVAMVGSRGHRASSSGSASSEGLTTTESGWVAGAPMAQTPPYGTPVNLITVTNPDGTTSGQVVRYQTHQGPGVSSTNGGSVSGIGGANGGGTSGISVTNEGGAPGDGNTNRGGTSGNAASDGSTESTRGGPGGSGYAGGRGASGGNGARGGVASASSRNGSNVMSAAGLASSSSPAAGQTVTWDVMYEGASIHFDPRGVYQMGVKAHTTTWQGANIIGRSDTTRYYAGRYVRHDNRIIFLNGVGEKAPLLARGVIDTAGLLVSLPSRRGVTGGPAKLRFRPSPPPKPPAGASPRLAGSASPAGSAPARADTSRPKKAAATTAPSGGLFGWLSSKEARTRP